MLADGISRKLLAPLKKHCGRHNKAWCAESALDSAFLNKSFLNPGKFAVFLKTFQGADILSLSPDCQINTGAVSYTHLDVYKRQEGYDVMPEVEEIAKKNAEKSGGSFTKTNSMEEAFKDADIVYPKSWAPFAAMEKRTNLYGEGDFDGIDKLEKELLAQNAEHKDWACTEELMKTTKDGKALYLHCLPADITGVSCDLSLIHI